MGINKYQIGKFAAKNHMIMPIYPVQFVDLTSRTIHTSTFDQRKHPLACSSTHVREPNLPLAPVTGGYLIPNRHFGTGSRIFSTAKLKRLVHLSPKTSDSINKTIKSKKQKAYGVRSTKLFGTTFDYTTEQNDGLADPNKISTRNYHTSRSGKMQLEINSQIKNDLMTVDQSTKQRIAVVPLAPVDAEFEDGKLDAISYVGLSPIRYKNYIAEKKSGLQLKPINEESTVVLRNKIIVSESHHKISPSRSIVEKVQIKTQPQPQTKPQSQPQTKPQPQSQSQSQKKLVTKTESKFVTKIQHHAMPAPKQNEKKQPPKPQSKTLLQTQSKIQANPQNQYNKLRPTFSLNSNSANPVNLSKFEEQQYRTFKRHRNTISSDSPPRRLDDCQPNKKSELMQLSALHKLKMDQNQWIASIKNSRMVPAPQESEFKPMKFSKPKPKLIKKLCDKLEDPFKEQKEKKEKKEEKHNQRLPKLPQVVKTLNTKPLNKQLKKTNSADIVRSKTHVPRFNPVQKLSADKDFKKKSTISNEAKTETDRKYSQGKNSFEVVGRKQKTLNNTNRTMAKSNKIYPPAAVQVKSRKPPVEQSKTYQISQRIVPKKVWSYTNKIPVFPVMTQRKKIDTKSIFDSKENSKTTTGKVNQKNWKAEATENDKSYMSSGKQPLRNISVNYEEHSNQKPKPKPTLPNSEFNFDDYIEENTSNTSLNTKWNMMNSMEKEAKSAKKMRYNVSGENRYTVPPENNWNQDDQNEDAYSLVSEKNWNCEMENNEDQQNKVISNRNMQNASERSSDNEAQEEWDERGEYGDEEQEQHIQFMRP